MDQVFAARQVYEDYLANGKDKFWAFVDLKKANDRIDRHGICSRCQEYMELEENYLKQW